VENSKVTVILYPDDDGGYTAVMPYFSCHLTTQGNCLTAQGETAEEALTEARSLLEGYLALTGAEGRYHLEHARLEGLEVREMEVEAP
jgi:predicted RNase H-like HicB family nuclease